MRQCDCVQEGTLLWVPTGGRNMGPASDRAELFYREFWYFGRTKLLKYIQNCKLQAVAILQDLSVLVVVYPFGLKVHEHIHVTQSQLDLAFCSPSLLKRKIVLFCVELCHHLQTLLLCI